MRKLNPILLLTLLMGAVLFTTSCNGDEATCEDFCTNGTCVDGECVPDLDDNVELIDRNIETDETWTNDKIYRLAARVTVLDGATLTIEPGTIIKGEAGSGANATALLVARGGKLMADGNSDNPIIFTSVADEIQPGEIVSPNLDDDQNGLWGGIIVLGSAPISAAGDAVQIEGIPPSDANGLYGGSDPTDNSGIIRYVSIRHGGANIGEGNEINGLTLGGVGSGTTIEYIEVVANQDDGIEPFGGSVNVSNIIVWNQGDDAYDCDQAYTGTIDNFIFIGGSESDHGMELDGPEGSATGTFTLRNGSLKGWNDEGTGGGEYIDFRDGVTANIENCYFFNFSQSSDVELDNNGVADNWLDETLNVSNLEFNVSHLSSGNTTIEQIFQDKGDDADDAFSTRTPSASIVTSPSVGADASVFTDWTLAHARGMLVDFQ